MVTTYVGTPGITFDVEHLDDVIETIDALHTQVIDNLDCDPQIMTILDAALVALNLLADERSRPPS